MSLRLMYVLPAENFGGAERQGILHVSRLPQLGIHVVTVTGPGDRIRSELAAAGVNRYHFMPNLPTETHHRLDRGGQLRWAMQFLRDWTSFRRDLARIAIEERVDLVLANRSWAWVDAAPVAHALGLPMVWRGGSRMTNRAEALLLRALASACPPDLVVANCEAVRQELAPRVGCETRLLPNAVDVHRFDPDRVAPSLRLDLGLGDDVPVVGFLARPAPEKGMETLARVVARTVRAMPSVRFLLAGEFGWRDHYQRMFAAEGFGDHVTFLGHVADVPAMLRSCDVTMLTSRQHTIEGSPNAVLEAMAMRRPVVATRVGGIPEAIHDGVEGFLSEDGDDRTLADGLLRLLGAPELRQQMGAAGRRHILTHHREEVVMSQLADLLRAVHARGGRDTLAGHRDPDATRAVI